jgi:integrase
VVGATSHIAESTVKAYARDWRHFAVWCSRNGLRALPATPFTIAHYIDDLAEFMKLSTIVRRLAAISNGHAAEHHDSPCASRYAAVAQALADARRSQGKLCVPKAPLTAEDLRRMVLALPNNKLGARDAALLLLGFAGGLQGLELAALNTEDIEELNYALRVTLRYREADQASSRHRIVIRSGDSTACPVLQYQHWIEVSGITCGAVFRPVDRHGNIGDKAITPQVVALAVKRACVGIGLDPACFGVTSLRSGWRASREEKSSACRQPLPLLSNSTLLAC